MNEQELMVRALKALTRIQELREQHPDLTFLDGFQKVALLQIEARAEHPTSLEAYLNILEGMIESFKGNPA